MSTKYAGKYAICSLLANVRSHMRSHVRYKLACLILVYCMPFLVHQPFTLTVSVHCTEQLQYINIFYHFRVIWRWIILWPWYLGYRSLKIIENGTVPFKSLSTFSNLLSIVTMALSCIMSEIKQDICRKLKFFVPRLHSTPSLESPQWNIAIREKVEWLLNGKKVWLCV